MLLLQARTRKHDNASATQFSAFAAQVKFDIDVMSDRIEFRYNESLKTICIVLILVFVIQYLIFNVLSFPHFSFFCWFGKVLESIG